MNNLSLKAIFHSELIAGERIHWTGQPNPKRLLSPADIYLIPFSALWWGFALFWEWNAIKLTKGSAVDFFPLFGLFFVIVGFYFAIGRFFYKYFKRKKTYYALTNKRILIKSVFFGSSIQTLFVKDLQVINKSNRNDKSGQIIFGNGNYYGSYDTGLGVLNALNNIPIVPAFYDIENVDQVYEKIIKLRD